MLEFHQNFGKRSFTVLFLSFSSLPDSFRTSIFLQHFLFHFPLSSRFFLSPLPSFISLFFLLFSQPFWHYRYSSTITAFGTHICLLYKWFIFLDLNKFYLFDFCVYFTLFVWIYFDFELFFFSLMRIYHSVCPVSSTQR